MMSGRRLEDSADADGDTERRTIPSAAGDPEEAPAILSASGGIGRFRPEIRPESAIERAHPGG
jgi:hypothetical protein